MNKGQTVISVLLWAIGIMATAGLGLNYNNMVVNSSQEDKISTINRETGEIKTDIRYIKEAVDDLKEVQLLQLKVQGIIYKFATST